MFIFHFRYLDVDMAKAKRSVHDSDPVAYELPVLLNKNSEWYCREGQLPIDTWKVLLYAGVKHSLTGPNGDRHLAVYEREKVAVKTPTFAMRMDARLDAWFKTACTQIDTIAARVRTYNRFEGAVLFFLTTWTIIGLVPATTHQVDQFVVLVIRAMALVVALIIAFGMSLKQIEAYRRIMALNLGTEEQVKAACERHDYNVRAVVKELLKE